MKVNRRTRHFFLRAAAALRFWQSKATRRAIAQKTRELVRGYQKGTRALSEPQPGRNLPVFDISLLPRYVISEKSEAFAVSATHPSPLNQRALPARLKTLSGKRFKVELSLGGDTKISIVFRRKRTIYRPQNIYALPNARN